MRAVAHAVIPVLVLLLAGIAAPALADTPESGVIRLRPSSQPVDATPDLPGDQSEGAFAEPRRGFDYDSFVARLESLWFQRKTLLADGREGDAARQSQLIRAFCSEEGIRRLDHLAGALVSEADRYQKEGSYDAALESLELAEAFDPGRPQIHFARAAVIWKSGRHRFSAVGELLTGLKAGLLRSLQDLSLFNRLALVLVVALVGSVVVFSILMAIRYNIPFRHEIEERVVQLADDRLARSAGWAALFLPMLLWVGTGWVALYWILVTFRFMRRGEKLAAVALLFATILAVPAYRISVTVYGMTADPVVRTTLDSADGEYAPDRILKLRQLVQAYPEDPVYHFLLAGLYKNGRYFEEAFAEYKLALDLDPALEEAHVNVGNIFHTTGQYPEALAYYRKALEVNSRSMLALFNMHLAQSESFRFKEAEQALDEARAIDSQQLAELLTAANTKGDGPAVLDASLQMGSVWQAALGGGEPQQILASEQRDGLPWLFRQFVNPVSVIGVLTLIGCGLLLAMTRADEAARRCIRCGRPFCHFCKSGREGHEYCSQCLHLFVLGDGLAPETKMRKIYEVERHERRTRNGRRLLSTVLPGAAQLLRGRAGWGVFLLVAWFGSLIAWQPGVLRPVDRLAGLNLRLDLLGPESIPAIYDPNPFTLIAVPALLTVWLAGNLWRWKGREA